MCSFSVACEVVSLIRSQKQLDFAVATVADRGFCECVLFSAACEGVSLIRTKAHRIRFCILSGVCECAFKAPRKCVQTLHSLINFEKMDFVSAATGVLVV